VDQAALYLRSSKDRHDVSLDAQRRELVALAKARNLAIVEEFADAVESGKDDQRPGFQALLRRLKDPARSWAWLLALDTSRIARNQYLAHALHYEAEKRGIRVTYAKVPETNSLMDLVIRSIFQAFDQFHSLMSREKGLSGMAENVRQGWRAGGRAPMGYRLDRIPTGAMREGVPVTKSRLVPNADASRVGAYLKARAQGIARAVAARNAGLHAEASTMIGVEWNALTYAGHTVWNVQAERIGGAYKGGAKRRPRAEWLVQYDTHDPVISTEEAEAILARLEAGRPNTRRRPATYLLSGLLRAPDGAAWHGNGDAFYRLAKGKRIPRESLEQAVVARVVDDLRSDAFIDELVAEARRISAPPSSNTLRPLHERVNALNARIHRMGELAAECDAPRVFFEKMRESERERESLLAELEEAEAEERTAEALRTISAPDVRRILDGLAEHLESLDREAMKDFLAGLIERIELDEAAAQCRIHYRISTGDKLASPRGFEPRFAP